MLQWHIGKLFKNNGKFRDCWLWDGGVGREGREGSDVFKAVWKRLTRKESLYLSEGDFRIIHTKRSLKIA